MALITRCPVCGTLFKVVPDQLRISEGWVRCGHCAEVFDASIDLQQSDVEHQLVQPLEPLPDTTPEIPAHIAEPCGAAEPFVPLHLGASLAEDAVGLAGPLPPLTQVVPEEVALAPADGDAPGGSPSAETELPAFAETQSYSFTREPPSQMAVVQPVWRDISVAVGLLLFIALGLQGVVYSRDRIAATWSETRPWLQTACAYMGCTVQALRRIEAIVIDSSSLSALQNEDAYRLSLVLKNQGVLDLAMPAIEFVLTDIDEQAVFRRVLTSHELGAASRVLFAGREWATSVDLSVTDSSQKSRIVGYRLLVFYP